ncbi:MAG: DUF4178 domain-containing protein [Candidatus Moranbacteria bacterium]|nr:DUF4178 domain-containing protein [Candidatus Moranbacteria bacterium]
MKVQEFRENIRAGVKIVADGKEFEVEEVVKFRFDDGNFYIKCFMSDGFVLADDENENSFVLVKEIKNDFMPPFPKILRFDGKEFEFLFEAHAVAEEIEGKEIFKKGDSETFWDFSSAGGAYLSLGINDRSGERQDFYGKILEGVNLI